MNIRLWLYSIIAVCIMTTAITMCFTCHKGSSSIDVAPVVQTDVSLSTCIITGVSKLVTDSITGNLTGSVGETYKTLGMTMPVCDACPFTRSVKFDTTPVTMLVGYDLLKADGRYLSPNASCKKISGGEMTKPLYRLTTSMVTPELLSAFVTAPARTSGGVRTGRQVSQEHYNSAIMGAVAGPVRLLIEGNKSTIETNYLKAIMPFFQQFCAAMEDGSPVDIEVVLDGKTYSASQLMDGPPLILPGVGRVTVDKTFVEEQK